MSRAQRESDRTSPSLGPSVHLTTSMAPSSVTSCFQTLGTYGRDGLQHLHATEAQNAPPTRLLCPNMVQIPPLAVASLGGWSLAAVQYFRKAEDITASSAGVARAIARRSAFHLYAALIPSRGGIRLGACHNGLAVCW